jgi:outer membrane protein assembly factor BamE
MKKIIIVTFILAVAALSGCASGLLSIYKIDVQQGNALKQEAVDQLDVGMKPEQVRFLLGHPMVIDIFQPDRWYYVYYFKPGDGQPMERRLTVYFNDNEVVRIDRPEPATKLAKR